MTLKGIGLLPPVVKTDEALKLYHQAAHIERLIGKVNAELSYSIANINILQILTLNESIQSTRIEGTQVTFTDMIDQAVVSEKTKAVTEVDNYREALNAGVEELENGFPISSRLFKKLHRILMQGKARGTTSSAGEFRKIQNFIGPTNDIKDAVYIPISADKIPDYMNNLEYFINGAHHASFDTVAVDEGYTALNQDSNSLIKLAITHAQFESIHPFLDGNGRMGRILIVLSSMMDQTIEYPVFFISEELEKERIKYYNRLNAVRGDDPDWYAWISFFLESTERMANSMIEKLENISKLAKEGIKKLPMTDKGKNVWFYTVANPFCTANEVASYLNISSTTARTYLNRLADAGLIEKDQSKKRNILYVNYESIRAIS